MGMISDILKSFRIKQWIKNIFIFTPLIFALKFQIKEIVNSTFAFLLFCLICGSIYLINDCIDKKEDQHHPRKKLRPVASGRLKIKTAITVAVIIMTLSFVPIFLLNTYFLFYVFGYIFLMTGYSLVLKKIVILDVMIISIGFVIRVMIGGVIVNVKLSPWILIITFLGSILLGLIKRRQELIRLKPDTDDLKTRLILKEYNQNLLDQLISITTSATLISYIIYVLDSHVQQRLSDKLYFTVPFLIFGIFRYLYLTYSKGQGESPEEIIFSDWVFTLNGILWLTTFILLIC